MRTLNYAAPRRGRGHRRARLPDRRATTAASPGPPRELGDVFICPEQATDVTEAAVHGALHLCGYDHETDDGEMLALQAKVMAWGQACNAVLATTPTTDEAGSSGSRGGRTSASRPWSTRSSAPTSRSSPSARRPPGARSAASPPTSRPAGSSSSPTCPASSARATRSPSACSAGSSARSPTPTRCSSSSTPSRASAPATASSPRRCSRRTPSTPVICAVNKIDRLNNAETRRRCSRDAPSSEAVDEIFPVSARTGAGLEPLIEPAGRAAARGAVPVPARAALRPAQRGACSPS